MTWVIKTTGGLDLKTLAIRFPMCMRPVWAPVINQADGTRSSRASLKRRDGKWMWPLRFLNCLELKLCMWCILKHRRASTIRRCNHQCCKARWITVNIWASGIIKLVNVRSTPQSHIIVNWILYNLQRYTHQPQPCLEMSCRLCVSQVDFKVGDVTGVYLGKTQQILGVNNTEFEAENYHGLRYTPEWADKLPRANVFKTAKGFICTNSSSGDPEHSAYSFATELYKLLGEGGALIYDNINDLE